MNPSRRQFTADVLRLTGGALLLSACGRSKPGGGASTDGVGADSGDTDPMGDTASGNTDWATGGTASMAGGYPDPFDGDSPADCAMVCAMTLGPCYSNSLERKDISEGATGLPVRLALRVVDTDCKPVSGVFVDIWHATLSGLYSGEDAADMCTKSDADMLAHRYFRGYQKTDAEGKVAFDTCFPGWYSGRAIHIHFQIRDGAAEGSGEWLTAQLFFEPALISEVCTTHPAYVGRGEPDTANEADKVLGDNDPAPYTLAAAKQADGALLAWKTLVIRSSRDTTLCEAPEAR